MKKDKESIDALISQYAQTVDKDIEDVTLSEIRETAIYAIDRLKKKHHCVPGSDGLPVNCGDHFGDRFTVYKIKNDYHYHTPHCSKCLGSRSSKPIPIHIFNASTSLVPCEYCHPAREDLSWMKDMQEMYQYVRLIDRYAASYGISFSAIHSIQKSKQEENNNTVFNRTAEPSHERDSSDTLSGFRDEHPFFTLILVFGFIFFMCLILNALAAL